MNVQDTTTRLFGLDMDEWPDGDPDDIWVENPARVREQVRSEGDEVIFVGDPGDPMLAMFEDGELLAVSYVSTRGRLYQAGLYDRDGRFFFRSNFGGSLSWTETESVCGRCAKDFYMRIEEGR